jgi:hypothetical protein
VGDATVEAGVDPDEPHESALPWRRSWSAFIFCHSSANAQS